MADNNEKVRFNPNYLFCIPTVVVFSTVVSVFVFSISRCDSIVLFDVSYSPAAADSVDSRNLETPCVNRHKN
jgi:hypothetical protein